jgi:hypothetical protein
MKKTLVALVGLAMLQGVALAQQPQPGQAGPVVEMVDGKLSVSARGVPLGRLLGMIDKATGMSSKVNKPELEGRNITTQFTGLEINDAVRKIFQGQPLNYVLVHGQGIRVTEIADASGSTASSSGSPSFPASQPLTSSPIQQNVLPPAQNPAIGGQPAVINTPFGQTPNPNAAPANNNQPSTAPLLQPGMPPPPIGASNPLNQPQGGVGPAGNNPALPSPPPSVPTAPPAPGTLGGPAPGTIGR